MDPDQAKGGSKPPPRARPSADSPGADSPGAADRLAAALAQAAADGLEPLGLAPAGAGGATTDAALLFGFAPGGWARFRAAPEARDGAPDPLDRWSARIARTIAAPLGARAVGPNDGPPYPPFLAWAAAARGAAPSPLGMTADGARGLWLSFRFALLLGPAAARAAAARLTGGAAPAPCAGCAARPCVSACPVGAFAPAGPGVPARYDAARCAAHLNAPAGADCMASGCRARRACPVGRDHAPGPDQAAFHMRAFRAGAISAAARAAEAAR